MNLEIFGVIGTILGIIGTIIAWKLNPRRAIYQELDEIYQIMEKLYAKRDQALRKNDNNTISVIVTELIKLRRRKNLLSERLGNNSQR